jgi:hypothetical protein
VNPFRTSIHSRSIFKTRQQPLHRLKLFGRQRIPQLIQHRQFLLGSKSCWLSYFGFLAIRPVFPILIFVRTPAIPTAPKTASPSTKLSSTPDDLNDWSLHLTLDVEKSNEARSLYHDLEFIAPI